MKINLKFSVSFVFLLISLYLSLITYVNAVTVDFYQDCESGNHGDVLTSAIMDASSYGGKGWGWTAQGTMWVSTNCVRRLPGTVTVGGVTYTDSGIRTWVVNDKYSLNHVSTYMDGSPAHITLACYLTIGPTVQVSNNFDTIGIDGNGAAVLQQHNWNGQGPYIRAHSMDIDWKSTVSASIKVVSGKTYWINLKFDGQAQECYVAVFDPDTWNQVGDTISCNAYPRYARNYFKVLFGRTDNHGNNLDAGTQTYYDNIMIDYTDPPFPLLPDVSSDTTPPSVPAVVRDGTGTDIDSTQSTTQLSANWDEATDAESWISGYKYTIGTTQGGTNITNWTTIGNVTYVTKTGLNLTTGSTYYFSVKAINGASLESANATNSNGQYVTDKQAMAYWKFDEGTGSSVADYSGNGNTGTLSGNPTWTTGKVSGGISLDGNDDIVTGSYTPPENNFTMCAWVIATTTHEIDTESSSGWTGISGQKYLFWPCQSGANAGAGVSVGTNGISVYEHGAAYMPPLAVYSGTIGTGWNHIVVVYENKQPKIYLNGALVRTGVTSTKSKVYVSTAVGGGEYGHFSGTVDEVKIYPVSLTSQEVLDMYNSYSTDTTSPTAPSVVRDGTGSDVDSTTLTTQLSANWTAATDNESSISNYEYAIGTTLGATNTTNGWISNSTNLTVAKTGLTLTVGTTYYFSVRAQSEGGTGLAVNSNGQYVSYQQPVDSGVVITNVQKTNITENSVTITWTTDKGATSQVEYGVTAVYGQQSTVDSGLVTSHSVNITGLAQGTTYHYKVKSDDGSGHTGVGTDNTFVTNRAIVKIEPGISAFPNPCDFKAGEVIKFVVGPARNASHSDAGGEVEIYTLSGKLVRKVRGESGTGEITWDGMNEEGNRVAKGIYIYIIIESNGDKTTGKIGVTK